MPFLAKAYPNRKDHRNAQDTFCCYKYQKRSDKVVYHLSMALVSGFFMQSVFTSNIIVKISFTIIAWLIYLITFIGIKFFNLTVKRSVRNLFISLLAVLIAYIANFYLVYN